MRITNSILQREAIVTLQRNSSGLEEAQRRVTSGLKLEVASDDPVAAAEVMRANSGLRALDQYRRNIDSARARLASEESVLDQVGNLLTRATELGLSQGGDTANAQTRTVTKAEVDQLLDQLVQIGNTRVNGAYLFGGDFTDQAPIDGAGNGPATPLGTSGATTVGPNRSVATNHEGYAIFSGSNGPLAALRALSTALGANDAAGIRTSLGQLDAAFDNTQALLGEVGARTNQLDIASTNVDALDATLKASRADLSETDLEQAITTLVSRQTAYQAALASTSRILTTSLTDYLR